ncbi:hypothetical protein TPHA_0G03190 [Tetrapisispora phaffii CBS 4417]|uniref:Vacuolar aminopeptidase 1 n=1 Tax=Tetrapisispora phaffii (strain ATCC 24235 / CBS 4417 / NBRC 1672 / NRRL Y-8282 / UCD 70-5) TaxID=1071381 RepID=G8BW81_TETPH|nr:hypothetical protein TPHA_0G03190 [Tetrapisispora phaffii CBS 4417]CCE64159.1 hypothetical protein TPHA_0G03190 [Tetrapisispora phaffii CBS 4417]
MEKSKPSVVSPAENSDAIDQEQLIKHLQETLSLLTEKNKSSTESGYPSQTLKKKIIDEQEVSLEALINYSNIYIDFTYENPTIYHVVQYFSKLLENAGFEYISETDEWSHIIRESKNNCFYTTRNKTSLCAFKVDPSWKAADGVSSITCHIDSLNAKLKPASVKDDVEGYVLLGVAPYGGTLDSVWFDRDLGIGGKIVYKDGDNVKSTLINSTPHPIARIPTLAPHFGAPAVGPFDKEDQAVPIIGFGFGDDEGREQITEDEKKSPLYGKHSIHLLRYIANLANINVSQIQQVDLDLFDVQKGSIGGLKDDFLFAPRLDDRLCSFAAITSFIESHKRGFSEGFNMVTLYDNEEVGSLTRQGAKGGLMETVVQRVSDSKYKGKSNFPASDDTSASSDIYHQIFANSLILSADVNHLFNPNFKEVYMKNHSPKPNVGVTLSLDPNAHMATDLIGVSVIEEIARMNNDKIQYFQIKNNSRSGGTIGPSISSQTGARTVDLGIAQLSMHSIRATTGSHDIGLAVKFFNGFYRYWRKVYSQYNSV